MNKALVFAPHPDDETLACGGTIAKKVKEGYDVSVVLITDGRHTLTDMGISSRPTPFEVKSIRREEAFRATKVLGLGEENLLLLDFEDKTLEKCRKRFQTTIVRILSDFSPDEVFFPQEREYHADHRITNLAVRKAIEMLKIHTIQYQYIVAWAFPFYLLAHAMNEYTFDHLMARLSKADLIHVDISRFMSQKAMAIQEYRSQTTLISPEQTKPALKPSLVKRFSGSEERFLVNSPNLQSLTNLQKLIQ